MRFFAELCKRLRCSDAAEAPSVAVMDAAQTRAEVRAQMNRRQGTRNVEGRGYRGGSGVVVRQSCIIHMPVGG